MAREEPVLADLEDDTLRLRVDWLIEHMEMAHEETQRLAAEGLEAEAMRSHATFLRLSTSARRLAEEQARRRGMTLDELRATRDEHEGGGW